MTHTQGHIVRNIRFFDKKSHDFIWLMLPLFIQMKVYKMDFLYGQGDEAAEIFFIFRGRVKFYFNTGRQDDKGIDILKPINVTVEGSYFGDIEVLLNQGREGRLAIAMAMQECQLLVITKSEMKVLLKKWPQYRKEMKMIAQRRRQRYNKSIDCIFKQLEEQDEILKEKNGNRPLRAGTKKFDYVSDNRRSSSANRDPTSRTTPQVGRQNTEKHEGELILQRLRD